MLTVSKTNTARKNKLKTAIAVNVRNLTYIILVMLV